MGHTQVGAAQLGSGQYVQQTITPGQTGMTLHVWGQGAKTQLQVTVKHINGAPVYADQTFALGASWTYCAVAVSDAAVGQPCVVQVRSAAGTLYADDVSITCAGGKVVVRGSPGWAGLAPAAAPGDFRRPPGLAAPLAQQPIAITKYYYFGSQRVALRRSGHPDPTQNGLFFLHGDHLGSTSLLTNSNGQKVTNSETWYYPGLMKRGSSCLPRLIPFLFRSVGWALVTSEC